MSRIHPAAENRRKLSIRDVRDGDGEIWEGSDPECPAKLTVWKRSSMTFQGTDGFTVFDQQGRLAFRVDNYSRSNSCGGGLVLMDGAGNALLTLRPQMWSLHSQWNAYREDSKLRVFSMRRSSYNPFQTSTNEVQVFLGKQSRQPDFRIEGSFGKRNCCVRSSAGEVVATVSRKRSSKGVMLGNDVFNLEVIPDFDTEMIMGFVVILDRICRKPSEPILCY